VKARPSAARPPRVVGRAHAKVNLDLRVLGTRADGYHELRTVFQSIDLYDTLTAQEKPGPFVLKCRTAGVPLDDRNLVWRAAAALWRALGRAGEPADTVVTLEKAIPMQAGLGGGSADAAAALQVLARLWGGAPLSLLREVAATVGSDAPFFLSGGTRSGSAAARKSIRWSIFRATGSSSSGRRSACPPSRPTRGTTKIAPPACASRAATCRSCPCPGRPGRRR
jgi:hypothetical protein